MQIVWVHFPPSATRVFKGHLGYGDGRDTGSNGSLSDDSNPPSPTKGSGGTEDAKGRSGVLWGAMSTREDIDILEIMETLPILPLLPSLA